MCVSVLSLSLSLWSPFNEFVQVAAAKSLLNAMDSTHVTKIKAKQAVSLVLTKQAEIIQHMVSEGLLNDKQAEEFLDEIGEDLQRMDKKRNKMYW